MSLALVLPERSPLLFRGIAATAWRVALYVALGAVTLSPLLWVRVPPLVDYPSHIARMWILVHGAEIPELARNYTVHWRLLPDLAMDLIVPVLSTMMAVEQAGRVFIAPDDGNAHRWDRGLAPCHPRVGRDMADLVCAFHL